MSALNLINLSWSIYFKQYLLCHLLPPLLFNGTVKLRFCTKLQQEKRLTFLLSLQHKQSSNWRGHWAPSVLFFILCGSLAQRIIAVKYALPETPTQVSDVRTLIFCNTGSTSIAIRLFNSQKNNAIFASFAQAVLFTLWERLEHLLSPSAPTQPPTHIWAILHSAQTQAAHAFSHRKNTTHTSVCTSHSSHSFSLSCTHIHTNIWLCHKL